MSYYSLCYCTVIHFLWHSWNHILVYLVYYLSWFCSQITKYVYVISQGAKWVYLTWDAVKGCLVSFCSAASTYQILSAQPENYVAGKKLWPFSHFPLLLILSTFSETLFFLILHFQTIIVVNLWEIHLLYAIHSKCIHIHGAYILFVIKNVIFKLILKTKHARGAICCFLIIIYILDNVLYATLYV